MSQSKNYYKIINMKNKKLKSIKYIYHKRKVENLMNKKKQTHYVF